MQTTRPQKLRSKAETINSILKTSFQFRGKRDRNISNRVKVSEVRFAKLQGDLNPYLIVKSTVNGTPTKENQNPTWRQTMHLINPQFSTKKSRKFPVPVDLRGRDLFMRSFDGKSKVRLTCSCPDHRHRFHWYNADASSHVGKRIPYQKKTDRPRMNDKPGHCKHLVALIEYLAKNNVGVIDSGVVSLQGAAGSTKR